MTAPRHIFFDFDETFSLYDTTKPPHRERPLDDEATDAQIAQAKAERLKKIRNPAWLKAFMLARKKAGDFLYIVSKNKDRATIERYVDTLFDGNGQDIMTIIMTGNECPRSISKNEFIEKILPNFKSISPELIILIDNDESHCQMARTMHHWTAVYAEVGSDQYMAELEVLMQPKKPADDKHTSAAATTTAVAQATPTAKSSIAKVTPELNTDHKTPQPASVYASGLTQFASPNIDPKKLVSTFVKPVPNGNAPVADDQPCCSCAVM